MLSWAVALIAFAPAKPKNPPMKLVQQDDFPWVPYRDDAPLMDPHDFTRWCLTIGENDNLGRVALHTLAIEYCCQEMAGRVSPPKIDKVFPHLKVAGWQKFRPPTRVKDGQQHRPMQYRVNQYALSK